MTKNSPFVLSWARPGVALSLLPSELLFSGLFGRWFSLSDPSEVQNRYGHYVVLLKQSFCYTFSSLNICDVQGFPVNTIDWKVHIKNCESDLTWGWGWSSETLRQVSLASSSPGFEFGALGPEQWPESRGKFRSIGSGVSLTQGEGLVSQLHLSHDLLLLLLKAEQEKRGTDR